MFQKSYRRILLYYKKCSSRVRLIRRFNKKPNSTETGTMARDSIWKIWSTRSILHSCVKCNQACTLSRREVLFCGRFVDAPLYLNRATLSLFPSPLIEISRTRFFPLCRARFSINDSGSRRIIARQFGEIRKFSSSFTWKNNVREDFISFFSPTRLALFSNDRSFDIN